MCVSACTNEYVEGKSCNFPSIWRGKIDEKKLNFLLDYFLCPPPSKVWIFRLSFVKFSSSFFQEVDEKLHKHTQTTFGIDKVAIFILPTSRKNEQKFLEKSSKHRGKLVEKLLRKFFTLKNFPLPSSSKFSSNFPSVKNLIRTSVVCVCVSVWW